MENSMSRILIETMVKKALRDIKKDPERSIRNLVDMALQFSKGRFQKRILEVIQEMLQNEDSAYYTLVQDVVTNVEHERLLNFGMNVGYNSCTHGAEKIRKIEKESGYNVPWAISMELESNTYKTYAKRYEELLTEGEQMGIYTWVVLLDDSFMEFFSLVDKHPDCAFVIFGKGSLFSKEFIKLASEYNNIMLAVPYDENADNICKGLREEKMLYGVYYDYEIKDIPGIESGELINHIQTLHPSITILKSKEENKVETQKEVYEFILNVRQSQKYSTLVWDFYSDICFVDEIISDDSCFVYFDKEGNLAGENTSCKQILWNYSLQQILKQNFGKKQE